MDLGEIITLSLTLGIALVGAIVATFKLLFGSVHAKLAKLQDSVKRLDRRLDEEVLTYKEEYHNLSSKLLEQSYELKIYDNILKEHQITQSRIAGFLERIVSDSLKKS